MPDRDGVAVIYGDNNLGKTTILNSVRWLFTGWFTERTGRIRDDRELVNREAVTEAGGEPVVAKVGAVVTWGGQRYTLTRTVTLEGDELQKRLDVIRGSDALNAEEARATARQMIPSEIQQFFFFDAEALNRYEDLLHDPTTGEELKKAIERILGVPVLKNAINDLRALTEEHTKVISKLKTRDAKATMAAKALADLEVIRVKCNEDIKSIRCQISDLQVEKSDIEQQMAETEKARALLDNHRRLVRELREAEIDLDAARERFKEVAPQMWAAVLTPTLERELNNLYVQRDEVELAQGAFEREQLLVQLRRELTTTGQCPCCHQTGHPPQVEDSLGGQDQKTVLTAIGSQIETLERILDPAAVARLDERNRALQSVSMRVHDLSSDLIDAEKQIEGLEDPNLVDLPKQLANIKIQLRNRREDLREALSKQKEHTETASRLAAVIAERGGEAGLAATKKHHLLTDLQRLFSAAIDNYREELKQRVEREATKVFLSIRSDPDLARLSINEDYGLSIIHKDGELEPHRSAGYEHIVALSLVAALQRCAPVQAPIFMDMPFARLDPRHKLSTLRALPKVAAQVVVIVHEGEIDRLEARDRLESALICERKLTRRSARHTRIVEIGSP